MACSLNPYLINLLDNNEDEELIKRIFDFLEKMAVCSDILVQEVVAFTVLEKLGDDKEILAKAQKYMGEETKKMSYETEKFWGRIKINSQLGKARDLIQIDIGFGAISETFNRRETDISIKKQKLI